MSENLRHTLTQAVSTYDRREAEKAARSKHGYHNAYALGQYLERCDEVCADVGAGATPRAAIIAAFEGRLRDACLRAIGETKTTEAEERAENLRPWTAGYTPVSER